eukprot:7495511-Pyramimonas_sp.AAC.1
MVMRREAALRFQELLERIVTSCGFEVCKTEPAIYRRKEKGIRVVAHRGHPFASGPTQSALDEFFDELVKHIANEGRR